MKKEQPKIYAFIDSQNLNLSIRNDLVDKVRKYFVYVNDLKKKLEEKYKERE